MKTAIVVFLFVAVFSCAYSASFPFNPAQPNYDNIPRCMQPPAAGLCLAYFPSFYYNPSTKKCESFIYGGCQGNQNRFINEEQCMKACGGRSDPVVENNEEREKPAVENNDALVDGNNEATAVDICSQPKVVGLCYASFIRFYFNGEKCESFIYGGCQGNQNNFESEEDCIKTCPPKTTERKETQE